MTSKFEKTYVQMSHEKHILELPDTYIGSIENEYSSMYILNSLTGVIEKKNINYIPGLYKLFDEILVNARDNISNDETCNQIDVECNISEGYVSIKNNGDIGIPIEKYKNPPDIPEDEKKDIYIPSLIFGVLLTSSNYNKNEEKTVGGKNGYGSKCIGIDTKLFSFCCENTYMILAKDIKVGDQIIGDNGKVRNVLNVIKGHSKMYEVSQSTGESYKVNDNHTLTLYMPDHKVIFWNASKQGWTMLWWDTKSQNIKTKTKTIKVSQEARIELEKFSDTIKDSNIIDINIQDYLKLSDTTKKKLAGLRGKCVEWKKKEVKLDPYILGLWLGSSESRCQSSYLCNDLKDPEILDYLNKWFIDDINNDTTIKKTVSTNNYENNLSNVKRKYIPKEYLINDRDTRLKVLAGIIDTDGHVSRNRHGGSKIIITQDLNHKQLVNDIVYLARTLGFACSLTIKNTSLKHKDILKKGQVYNINISGNIADIPTLLQKEKCSNSVSNNMPMTTGCITVKEIDETEYIGITVDDNQRFVINDFTVTHNCVNIFSDKFVVEINDYKRKKHFIQEWTDNMSKSSEPIIKDSRDKSSVKVTFYPDFKRFNINGFTEDYISLFHRRTIDIGGTTSNNKLKITFNNTPININNFKSYIELYYPNENIIFDTDNNKTNPRWSVGVIYKNNSNSEVISFVNGINTFKGGTHCNQVVDSVIKILINDYIKKKDKNLKLNPSLLKDNLVFFINSVIVNPSFSSQTKDTLTTKSDKFGSKYEPSQLFLKKISKSGLIEYIIEQTKTKENANLKKTDGKKQIKISGIPKLEDANKAGTKESKNCTLILTEGDSAKTTAMAGLSNTGRDYFGVFPLKGKLLNVREASNTQLLNNEEIKNLKTILGLKQGEDYSSDEKFNTLRYGHVIIFVDQDYDGSHIKGLFMNLIHSLWPSLLKKKNIIEILGKEIEVSFIQGLNTPIIKAFNKKKESDIKIFYTITDYDNWKNDSNNNLKNYNIKYYKGLGTSTAIEAKEYFQDIENKIINYIYQGSNDNLSENIPEIISEEKDVINDENESEDENIVLENKIIEIRDDDDALRLAFEKSRANDRKLWLKSYNKNNIIKNEEKSISYKEFVDKELIHFSNDDNARSMPSLIDGLKISHRKILFGCFKAELDKTEKKVSQLAGIVSDIAQYHHGEMSLNGAIIGMAQNYVGSNNINILDPNGQFGSRYLNGKDHASSRYIWTKLSSMATLIFKKVDNHLLNEQFDDGLPIEPEYYVPIIPMILVNGTEGIGTGFSTKIPPYNPINIIDNLLNLIDNKNFIEMDPWWQSFDGSINKITEYTYEIKGNYKIKDNKLIITELPIGESTYNYKEFLEKMLVGTTSTGTGTGTGSSAKSKILKKNNSLINYTDNNTDTKIYFELTFEDKYLEDNIDNIEKLYKLSKKYSITNMHLYNSKGVIQKYLNVKEIMEEYYNVRLDFYIKRKNYQLNILKIELENISHKVKFITMVINNEIIVNNKKRNIIELELEKYTFPKLGENKSYDYLLSMPIYNLTFEKIEELKKLEDKKQSEYNELNKIEPKELWKLELTQLKEEYIKWYEKKLLIDNNLVNNSSKDKKDKKNKKNK